jgi:hypothetical protein
VSIDFNSLTDRQKRLVEVRLAANEDEQFKNWPLQWIARDRRGYAFVKSRFQMSLGLQGRESGWTIDNATVADFGNIPGAATVRAGLTTFPLSNPMHVLGSLDPEPFELSTLTAITGDRQVGTSSQPIALLMGCFIVHVTAAGAVYQPAATTINIRVISTNAAVGGAFTTLATLVVNTAANFVDVIPITATTGRTVSITGTSLTNIAGLFNGDSLFAELVAGAATGTNLIYSMAELV